MEALLRSDRGVAYPLGLTTKIGRSAENDLVFAEGSLSREHARIDCRGGRWYIEDCASRNGTSVSGYSLPFARPQPLRDGDRIVLGTLAFTFALVAGNDDPERTTTIELTGIPRNTALSDYQQQVLWCMSEPWMSGGEPASNAEIAAQLGTPQAVDAVKAALRRIYAKFGLSGSPTYVKRRMLCEFARDHGLLRSR